MKHNGKYIYALIYLVALLGLASCSSKVNLTARTDGGTDVEFNTSFGKVLADTIKSISSTMGNSKSAEFFSAPAMQKALKDSDFTNVKVSTPNETSMNMSGSLPTADKQTHATGTLRAADFVSCTSNSMVLKLSPKNLKAFAGGLPQSTKNYLDLFMAPVFTGESMSREDYKMLIASIYGENIANELDKSSISINMAPPKGKTIKTASIPKNGSKSADKATFSIPLLDFLTLNSEQNYNIKW